MVFTRKKSIASRSNQTLVQGMHDFLFFSSLVDMCLQSRKCGLDDETRRCVILLCCYPVTQGPAGGAALGIQGRPGPAAGGLMQMSDQGRCLSMHQVLHSLHCSPSTVYCLLSIVYCLLSTIYCLLSTVYCLLSTVYCLLSTVYCLMSNVYCLLSTVYCLLSTV